MLDTFFYYTAHITNIGHSSLHTNVFSRFRQLELLNEDCFVSFPPRGSSGGGWRIRGESATCEFQYTLYLYNGLQAKRGRCFCFCVTEKGKGWRGQVGQESLVILKCGTAAESYPNPHNELGNNEQGASGIDYNELRVTHTLCSDPDVPFGVH